MHTSISTHLSPRFTATPRTALSCSDFANSVRSSCISNRSRSTSAFEPDVVEPETVLRFVLPLPWLLPPLERMFSEDSELFSLSFARV